MNYNILHRRTISGSHAKGISRHDCKRIFTYNVSNGSSQTNIHVHWLCLELFSEFTLFGIPQIRFCSNIKPRAPSEFQKWLVDLMREYRIVCHGWSVLALESLIIHSPVPNNVIIFSFMTVNQILPIPHITISLNFIQMLTIQDHLESLDWICQGNQFASGASENLSHLERAFLIVNYEITFISILLHIHVFHFFGLTKFPDFTSIFWWLVFITKNMMNFSKSTQFNIAKNICFKFTRVFQYFVWFSSTFPVRSKFPKKTLPFHYSRFYSPSGNPAKD